MYPRLYDESVDAQITKVVMDALILGLIRVRPQSVRQQVTHAQNVKRKGTWIYGTLYTFAHEGKLYKK